MQLTATFCSLLHQFRHVFTAPTFTTFAAIATGWCLSPRHRYVTDNGLLRHGGVDASEALQDRTCFGYPNYPNCLTARTPILSNS